MRQFTATLVLIIRTDILGLGMCDPVLTLMTAAALLNQRHACGPWGPRALAADPKQFV